MSIYYLAGTLRYTLVKNSGTSDAGLQDLMKSRESHEDYGVEHTND